LDGDERLKAPGARGRVVKLKTLDHPLVPLVLFALTRQ
jgi:hypothetical protein